MAGCGGSSADGGAGGTRRPPWAREASPVTEATITSPDISFDVTTVYVPAGKPVTITYKNQQPGCRTTCTSPARGVDEKTAITPGPDVADASR